MAEHTPSPTAATTSGVGAVTTHDRLLLAVAELGMYGIETRGAVATTPARARVELATLLAARAPHGLGSYVFWLRADEDLLDAAALPLFTSGPEVDRAVVAALAHHGLTARPGPRAGVLLAGP
jgi:hypothetical protein